MPLAPVPQERSDSGIDPQSARLKLASVDGREFVYIHTLNTRIADKSFITVVFFQKAVKLKSFSKNL